MAIISSKEQIKRSIEAASRGRQTVIFTPKGQHVIVNIIEPENIEDIMPGLGVTGTHPAFLVNGKKVKHLLVGTYPSSIIDNEGVSQAMSSITPGDYEQMADKINGMGTEWHMMNALEYGYFRMKAIQQGFRPLGNTADGNSNMFGWDNTVHTAFGLRTDGEKAGAASGVNEIDRLTQIYSGSGPASFRHDGTYNGVSDIVGNGFTFLYGVRFVGSDATGYEVQVLGRDNGPLTDYENGQLSMVYDGNGDWLAIDATTGGFITPSHTGSLSSGNYAPTTNNSVRLFMSSATPDSTLGNTGYALPFADSGGANMGFGLTLKNNVSAAATGRLRLIGALPFYEVSHGNTALVQGNVESLTRYPATGNIFRMLVAPSGMFNMRLTTNAYNDRNHVTRVCSYVLE